VLTSGRGYCSLPIQHCSQFSCSIDFGLSKAWRDTYILQLCLVVVIVNEADRVEITLSIEGIEGAVVDSVGVARVAKVIGNQVNHEVLDQYD